MKHGKYNKTFFTNFFKNHTWIIFSQQNLFQNLQFCQTIWVWPIHAFGKFQISGRLSPTLRGWVSPSKRGGMDGVFQGLAGLLWGISQGQSPSEILRSSPTSLRKTLSLPTLFLDLHFFSSRTLCWFFLLQTLIIEQA